MRATVLLSQPDGGLPDASLVDTRSEVLGPGHDGPGFDGPNMAGKAVRVKGVRECQLLTCKEYELISVAQSADSHCNDWVLGAFQV